MNKEIFFKIVNIIYFIMFKCIIQRTKMIRKFIILIFIFIRFKYNEDRKLYFYYTKII